MSGTPATRHQRHSSDSFTSHVEYAAGPVHTGKGDIRIDRCYYAAGAGPQVQSLYQVPEPTSYFKGWKQELAALAGLCGRLSAWTQSDADVR
jgi:hypothetical protein